jgi:predicted glycoside hydrolase/deacetylase ChbG (UPF0249 family)
MSIADASANPRPIWLCADDYGISPAVSRGIRELVAQGRLNATSAMVVAPSLDRAEAEALKSLNIGQRRVAIGLHLTLTGLFKPMTADYRPKRGGVFVSLAEMMVRGRLGLLDRNRVAAEIAAQLNAFVALFGQPPDFIDGHQHAHLAPQVRETLLDVMRQAAPNIWVRQCGGVRATREFKAWVLDTLSVRFRAIATERGIATNPAFAGAYDFGSAGEDDFPQLFPGFLREMPAGGVVMCHPGFVDAELERLDPLTKQREREYAYLASEQFPAALRANGLALA